MDDRELSKLFWHQAIAGRAWSWILYGKGKLGMMNCPECGAPNSACETRFHEFLIKEFENPSYGAVHHLTVTAYMLQHSSKLSREGWLHERDLLREFLVEKKPPAFI